METKEYIEDIGTCKLPLHTRFDFSHFHTRFDFLHTRFDVIPHGIGYFVKCWKHFHKMSNFHVNFFVKVCEILTFCESVSETTTGFNR